MIEFAAGQFILDCNGERDSENPTCTLSPYSPPPATVEHYSIAPTWSIVVVAVVVLAGIIMLGIIWYERIEEGDTWGRRRLESKKAELDAKARIAEAHKSCQNCGITYSPKLGDLAS